VKIIMKKGDSVYIDFADIPSEMPGKGTLLGENKKYHDRFDIKLKTGEVASPVKGIVYESVEEIYLHRISEHRKAINKYKERLRKKQ
jgi:hypothetical protein